MDITIGSLGSHSALDVCEGAKKETIRNLVVAQKDRSKTYEKYRTDKNDESGIVDEVIVVDKFSDMVSEKTQKTLIDKNTIFVPNRSFSVYVGYENIEKHLKLPVFGNKFLLKAEERSVEKNQYYLLEKAGIRTPKTFNDPKKIDRLCIVKVTEAKRTYERAFFLAKDYEDYQKKSENLLKSGKINLDDLKKARIEEYVVGAQFNLNFFYSPLKKRLELLGLDTRRQTNIDGFLRIPADEQMELLKHMQPTTIEVGHIACTIRESLLDQVFELGERFAEAVSKEYGNSKKMSNGKEGIGLVGPFALQGVFVEEGKEEFVCFDVSFRMPGSPGTRFTPYSSYLFRESISFGRRVAMEIKEAAKTKRMEEIVS